MLNFALYMAVSLALWITGLVIYKKITPYNEFQLIRDGNLSAAMALSGVAIGLALPLGSLAIHAVSLVDMAMWAGIALVVQLVLYLAFYRLMMVRSAIESDNRAVGLYLGMMSVGMGILNAACLTY